MARSKQKGFQLAQDRKSLWKSSLGHYIEFSLACLWRTIQTYNRSCIGLCMIALLAEALRCASRWSHPLRRRAASRVFDCAVGTGQGARPASSSVSLRAKQLAARLQPISQTRPDSISILALLASFFQSAAQRAAGGPSVDETVRSHAKSIGWRNDPGANSSLFRLTANPTKA